MKIGADFLIWFAMLYAYYTGHQIDIPAAMVPWRVYTWVVLIAMAYGFAGHHNYPMAAVVLMDSLACFAMIAAKDFATLAVFVSTMVVAYTE